MGTFLEVMAGIGLCLAILVIVFIWVNKKPVRPRKKIKQPDAEIQNMIYDIDDD